MEYSSALGTISKFTKSFQHDLYFHKDLNNGEGMTGKKSFHNLKLKENVTDIIFQKNLTGSA